MIEPTIARLVHFFPASDDSGLDRHDAPFAAVIAKVWTDGVVNLTVLDKQGTPHGRQHVWLVQDGEMPINPEGAFCEWMPYQVGQAARSDELVAALTARIETLEAKNQFDFAARSVERRVEALEAAAANGVVAVKDVFMGGQPMPAGGLVLSDVSALTVAGPKA